MEHPNGDRRRVHLHGLAAGSLLVLALFLFWTVPIAIARLVRGDVSWTNVLYPAIFSALLGAGIREARAWRRASAQAI